MAGSSPLARGLRIWWRGRAIKIWIIPARAGFTTAGQGKLTTEKDHPRSRGVYAFFSVGASCGLGSSPLARGLHADGATQDISPRIIPARAGFTSMG